MQNQNMNLVLSTDAKPRLKWTPELHQRFAEAVDQLGGADSESRSLLILTIFFHHTTKFLIFSMYGQRQHQRVWWGWWGFLDWLCTTWRVIYRFFLLTIIPSIFVANITKQESWTVTLCFCFFLQKYRLGKSQESEFCTENKEEGNFSASDLAIIAWSMCFVICLVWISSLWCRLQRNSGRRGAFQWGNQWCNRHSE